MWSWLGPEGSAPRDEASITGEQARALCDRHRGIGADGLIVVKPGSAPPEEGGADVEMVLFNADGGIAEMSGNGIRALAWVAVRDGYGRARRHGRLVVDTGGGRRAIDLELDPATGERDVRDGRHGPGHLRPGADPGRARLTRRASPPSSTAWSTRATPPAWATPTWCCSSTTPRRARVTQHGPHLEHDERFPQRTNVHFVRPTPGATDELDMRVWERGVGETLSCGTGASASAAVAHRRGLVGERVTVHVPGGDLTVELGDTIRLGGPVVHVFDTTVEL